MKPNFFIVGAPKCGTTSLAYWLARHPQVCMSRPKEPHYFSPNRKLGYGSIADYERCFAHARAEHRAIGEASTHTIYYPEAIERILAYQPEARFIVCLRNPAKMVVSYHNHLIRRLRQPVTDFAEAWEGANPMFSFYHPHDMPARDYYRHQCALGTHYARLLEQLPEGRLLTLLLEDMAEDPARELRRVTDFLGVAPSDRPYPKSNPARVPRIPALRRAVEAMKAAEVRLGVPAFYPLRLAIDAVNMVKLGASAPISPEMRRMLAAHFEPEVRKLEAALGRSLPGWHPDPVADPSGRGAA